MADIRSGGTSRGGCGGCKKSLTAALDRVLELEAINADLRAAFGLDDEVEENGISEEAIPYAVTEKGSTRQVGSAEEVHVVDGAQHALRGDPPDGGSGSLRDDRRLRGAEQPSVADGDVRQGASGEDTRKAKFYAHPGLRGNGRSPGLLSPIHDRVRVPPWAAPGRGFDSKSLPSGDAPTPKRLRPK